MLALLALAWGITLVRVWIAVSESRARLRRLAAEESPPKALPEPESRELELASWNDPRTWRGCSDYPPPSGGDPPFDRGRTWHADRCAATRDYPPPSENRR